MAEISPHIAMHFPRHPPQTHAAAKEYSEQVAQIVDHFAQDQEVSGNTRVFSHRFQHDGHQVQLSRTEYYGPSTGLRAAASGVAGVAGTVLGWVAPHWGQALKDWSQQTSVSTTHVTRTTFQRKVTDPDGNRFSDHVSFFPDGDIELIGNSKQASEPMGTDWYKGSFGHSVKMRRNEEA